MGWMKIKMTVKDVMTGRHIDLQDAFTEVFMATMAPMEAAVFVNSPTLDDYDMYFSPGAAAIFGLQLEAYDATKSVVPPQEDTSLLVGHADAWDMLGSSSVEGRETVR